MHAWPKIESGTPLPGFDLIANGNSLRGDDAANQEVQFLLRGLGNAENHARGSAIFKEGDNASAVYRVMSGAVALWRSLPNGKRHIIDFRLPGEYFGVVHRPTHTINAEASADTVLTSYRRGYVDGICDAVPSFHRSMSKLVAEPVVSRKQAAISETRTAKERIADFLLNAAERAAGAGEITLPISGHYIGERVDETDDVVSNCIRDLVSAGAVVSIGDGALMVTNPALLQSLTC